MRTRAIALAAAAATALSGCSMLGGDDEDKESGSPESSGVVNGDANENGAKEAGLDTSKPPKPIAEATLRRNSDVIESTKIELLELRRDDNVMLATYRLTGEGRGTEPQDAGDLLGTHTFEPVFIDMKNMEKYRNIDDMTSSLDASAPLGDPVYVFTAHPLPRKGVTSMDLQVTSVLASIEDVPVPK